MRKLFCLKEEKTYSFAEYRQIERNKEMVKYSEEITLLDEVIGRIKTNKKVYMSVVFMVALFLNANPCIASASTFGSDLDVIGNQLLTMFLSFAKWACLILGIKDMSVTMLNGGGVKDAINSSLAYLICYVFISLYPSLFSLFQGLNFN